MPVVNGYVTEVQLREHLGDDNSQLPSALLQRAINATSRAIDDFCGRRFWQDAAVVARVYRPRDPEIVYVHDISTDTGLVVATDTTGDGTYDTTWDAADYQLEPLNADVVAAGDTGPAFSWWQITAIDDKTFPVHARRPTLQVTTRFGWSAIPYQVEEAAAVKSASLFKRRNAPFGVAGVDDLGVVRISRRGDPDVVQLLNPFVRLFPPDI